jgi:hypothetical protein
LICCSCFIFLRYSAALILVAVAALNEQGKHNAVSQMTNGEKLLCG